MIMSLLFWNNSLRTKIVCYFLLISLIVLSLVGVAAYIQATEMLKQSVFDRLDAVATMKEDGLNRWIDDQIQNVVLIAWLPELQDEFAAIINENGTEQHSSSYQNLSQLLQQVLTHTSYTEEIFLLDQSGKVVFSTNASHEGYSFENFSFFNQGLSKTYVQTIYPSPLTGRPVIMIVTPVFDLHGRRTGILASHLSLERVDRILLERSGLGNSGESYLVDITGSVVGQTPSRYLNSSETIHSIGISAAVQGEDGSGLYENYRGVPVIGVYRWIREHEMALLVEMSQDEAFAPARQLAWMIFIIGMVLSGFLASGISFLAKQIAKPILAITETAIQVTSGDLTKVAPVLTNDEVGVLADAFNTMTSQLGITMAGLEDRIAQLKQAEDTIQKAYADLERRVTERTNDLSIANAELKKAIEAAEQANRSKSIFFANMSHEMRTPLNAIIGFSSLMASHVTDPQLNKYIRSIHSAGKTLLTLINDVLDFSKIEAGKLELTNEPADIRHICDEIDLMLGPKAREKGLEFTITIPDQIPVVLIDESRVRQVLLNLVGNAVKFTETGFVSLSLVVMPENPDFCSLTFTVRDSGIGIPMKDQQRVFSVFEQQNPGQAKRYGGTGLGLAISDRLITQMGGRIDLESAPGSGSTFTVFLHGIQLANRNSVSSDVSLNDQIPVSFSPVPVLVVDDVENNRMVLSDMIEMIGLLPIPVSSAREALDIVRVQQVTLILSDIRMPGMNGGEFLDAVRNMESCKKTPVIAVTALSLQGELEKCRQFDGVIRKPVILSELVQILSQFLPHTRKDGLLNKNMVAKRDDGTTDEPGIPPALQERITGEFIPRLSRICEVFTRDSAWELADDLDELLDGNEIVQIRSIILEIREAAENYDLRHMKDIYKRLKAAAPCQES
jgi:signal transduction histidine kinase/CheY-like chemotaxis protein